jgi:two-component system, OmpR family, alkaline phosphatase synthesis response regulator PhoP
MMNQKILIVDDEAYIRRLIERSLEELEDQGVELLTADNGESALNLIISERPGIVFLDVMLPRMNGFDVCHSVKHEHGLADVFIVMLTAKGQEYDRVRGINVGANVYMTKPFDPDALLKMAQEVLGI